MQTNWLIRIFGVLFGVISIYQLSYTFIVADIENKAQNFSIERISSDTENYLELREATEQSYLDSVANIQAFGYTNYADAKTKELNRGLDLKGGINVILQISVKDILKGLSENSTDPIFLQALEDADELQKQSNQPYIESFFSAFDNISGTTRLSSPNIFSNRSLSDEINFEMSDSEVQSVLRRRIDESIVSAFEVLRKRIDKFGVSQPNIQRLGSSGRILVELPGAKDVERIQNLLQSTAQLEFWETFKNTELSAFLSQANQVAKDIVALNTPIIDDDPTEVTDIEEEQTDEESEIDDLLEEITESTDSIIPVNPILDAIRGYGFQGGPILARFDNHQLDQIMSYLDDPRVRRLLPSEFRYVRFAWGIPGDDGATELYALKSNRENIASLSGGVVIDAMQSYDAIGNPSVSMQMDARGARIWESMTGKAFEQQSSIAIVLDDVVYSAPGVSSGAISGGRSEISGNFTLLEAIDLANVLRAGKLPASAEIIQSEVVGPSLGKEAIQAGVYSFFIALVFVLIWMIFYYGRAGLYADIALILNLLFIFGVLAGLGAVLTLPGIAGIVLTIGISVDANVLIFERVREELKKGKGLRKSVADGFSNALSSILDANITTGLTALILFVFGTGPIKGFATTLLIGIATSLFTAIFITRIFINIRNNKKKEVSFFTKYTKDLLAGVAIKFLNLRKKTYLISSIAIVICILSLFTQGLNQGVDFVGGRSYIVRFTEPVNAVEITNSLTDRLGSAEAKTFGEANQLKITTNYKVDVEGLDVDTEIQEIMYEVLTPYLPEEMSYEAFIPGSDEKQAGIMSSIKVGPTIADDIKNNSFLAVFGSLIVVFLYILLRFRRWQFSLGAVTAVFHDVLIVLGIFSLAYQFMPFNMEINQAFIAAILTVIGYSLNDTVVVFDRIREFIREHSKSEFHDTVNQALNSTLSRTLNTSLTTLIVLVAIFIFGGESIRGFMFALIIGVIVGTYSSVFIATPVMFDTQKKRAQALTESELEAKKLKQNQVKI
ncbi:MAG: protein translocase subunit SecDF [Flavobacteriaceae bacterium]|nr:protein translocase subunit SecDF [Flavobacteriaceae bacterium]MCY4267527.1 protein translocase subunit SecDF [Flavobacteriaceae bacterium]